MEKDYIFVYGLFRDQAKKLLGDNAKLVSRDSINGKIWKVNEFYPGFIRGEGKVWGDVFQIDQSVLPDLDEYEGDEYNRIRITTESGIYCWVYEYKHDTSEFIEIRSGDWYLR